MRIITVTELDGTRLSINATTHVIRTLTRYMKAAAVPDMWRNIDNPFPIERGNIDPQAK